MSYHCTTQGCANHTAQLPREAAEKLNYKCFLCGEGDLVEPGVTLEDMIEKVDILPVALQILPMLQALLNDDDASLDSIASTCRVDTSLVTRLIHVANSTYYSLAHGGLCSSVEQALQRIGLNKAYSVVGYVAAKQFFNTDLPLYKMSGVEMWENSVRTAYCMEKLAGQLFVASDSYKYPDPSMAYTAGLIWPIGKMVISQYYKNTGCSQLADATPPLTDEIEKEILGFTNMDVTMALLEKWRFPDEMMEAINYKDMPLNSPGDRPLACLLSLVISAVQAFPITSGEIEESFLDTMVGQFSPNGEQLNLTGIPKMDFLEVIFSSMQFVKGGHMIGQLR